MLNKTGLYSFGFHRENKGVKPHPILINFNKLADGVANPITYPVARDYTHEASGR